MTLKLEGKTFGNLLVLAKLGRDTRGKTRWKCKCLCGKESRVITNSLMRGSTKSCGCCEWHINHWEAYNSWQSARQRCFNENNKDYAGYGGRGITVCSEWEDFTVFYKDMGDPPRDTVTGERLSLDRIDVNGNYSKENCKWSDRSEQQLNKRDKIL